MKPVYLLFTFTVFLALFASKCKETPPDPCLKHTDTKTLPPKTECGANNFGCLVNGEVWVPNIDEFILGRQELHAEYSEGQLLVSAKRILKNQINESIKIVISSSDKIKESSYSLGSNSTSSYAAYANWNSGEITYTNDSIKGSVEITKFDRENFIISGTFSFNLIKSDFDTLRITQGRFDVRE